MEATIISLKPLSGNFPKISRPGLSIYEVVPVSAGQPFKLEIFDLSGPMTPHYHKIQSHLITVLEGYLEVLTTEKEPLLLGPLESITIVPGVIHNIKSVGNVVRFSSLASPAFDYPEDVYSPETPSSGSELV
ncbi:MAG: hypothetical protein A2977_00330 [Alphaproteobacteria bacterium RIFCSPLOWO2_01_FULL_45_8]|nr:MAG: hypothetical protein A2065_04290 [Alphaproteobacteria bacterium GWB1_45_5]OFW76783.1 MAG: hypothetical protein A3K20_01275 [Alphaproteobacteria bacterium GWA1_45_9]OFW89865.1 MAG: hypothetical protein A2621_03160 [Alphaproteobacteria bacterium RIFCSPHIGHO2_01_FULL_41_14]OFW96329.1 MAG: hypothetical protein A2977_00330 [Alphaproteobacteria bacterium RIFCSPLOWO2_01_FULL_45_8]HCI49001.1 hypothetical protein [Holosporales bacterium]